MKKRLFSLILIGLLGSCSQVETLSLKQHSFNQTANKIIWLQIPGLTEEHFAMLRFSLVSSKQTTSFENMSCMGKMWNYNLYGIRPMAHTSFLTQMLGTKNIKNSCEDYGKKPLWSFIDKQGFVAGAIEFGVNSKESLSNAWSCQDDQLMKKDLVLWKMSKVRKNSSLFHYQGKGYFSKGQVYYDKSCQGGGCYTSLLNNVKSLWKRFSNSNPKSVFIVRDFSYLKALKKRNISAARESLLEIEKVHNYFQNELSKDKNTLLLLTTAEGIRFEFPKRGRDWAQYESSGKHVVFRKSDLMSTVIANGAGAENFCGIYEESEVLKRTVWRPKSKNIEFSLPSF